MIAVIGGGPAGMMAAISAAENGSDVVIIEKNKILGKKLRITGKGRCNVTNACPVEEIFENIPSNRRFAYSAIYDFSNRDLMDFFEENGVPLKTERGQRVFPVSDKASDIALALERKISNLNIKIITDSAEKIIIGNNTVSGVLTKSGKNISAESVIIATGGKSYSRTGSDGSGYILSEKAGHSIISPKPSLVPIETVENTKNLMGLSLKNVSVNVFTKTGKKLFSDFGEMMFSHFGLTGPIILSASCHMGETPCDKTIEIDLKPALNDKMLDARITRDFLKYRNKDFHNSLSDLLPVKLIGIIIERSGIDPYKKVNMITKEERKKLVHTIKHFSFTPKGYRPIEEAIVTSGGVSVKEIDPSTMMSKITDGLYFAGEIIDIDAYTGGFNLQIAFSTGHLAGKSAAERERGF